MSLNFILDPKKCSLLALLLFSATLLFAQRTIIGTVTDAETGKPLLGTTIQVPSLSIGTVTDFAGKYEFSIPSGATALEFSYTGYTNQTIEIGAATSIDVQLRAGELFEQVVVVGYGKQRKSDVTGAVSSLKPRELQGLPVSRTDQLLQGRVSGVVVNNNNASPNAETTIRIRGSNSLLGNNNPLVVIDGVQGGNLSLVHPNDIESIEVLKDASALSVYGSRGANGAVLVTTKKGGNGRPLVSYSNYFASHEVRNKLDLLNASDYAERINQDASELGGTQVFTSAEIADYHANGGTDWQDEIFRRALAQNHHLSVGGARDNLNYYLSGDVLNQEGIVKGSDFQRYSFRANVGILFNERWQLNTQVLLARLKDSPVRLNSFAGSNGGSPINSALLWSPTNPIFDANENYTLPGIRGIGPVTDYNPVALAQEPIRENIQNLNVLNASLQYKILEGLTLRIHGSYRGSDNENSTYLNNKPTQVEGSESASIFNARSVYLQNTNQITYQKDWNNDHRLTITGVFEQQYQESNGSFLAAQGFISDLLLFDNLGQGSRAQPLSSFRTKRSMRSYLSRVNYVLKNKYLLTLAGRWDASSVFGTNNKWSFFPSAALGWVVSKEPFLQDVKAISNLKTRISYGVTGNQAIEPGASIATIGDNFAYPIDGTQLTPGIGLSDRGANPNLRWESTRQLNIGVDAEFFDGKVNFVADYYSKHTKDLLFERPLAEASGFSTSFVNIGEVENAGVEVYLEGTPINKSFVWRTGFSFAKNKNKILSLIDESDRVPVGNPGFPGFDNFLWLEVGEPIGLFRGVKYDGVWQASEADGASLYGAIPGSPKGLDQNNDGIINDEDVIVLGNSQPDFSYGWNNTFSYKNFNLNVFVQGVQGIDKLNLSKLQIQSGTSADLKNRWTPTQPNTNIPSAIGDATYNIPKSDRYIEDASYTRIKNISLAYVFPKDLISKWKLGGAKIYVSGYNLFTFTNYSGFDPESSTDVDVRGGVDLATFPEQKIYTVGLDISF